MTARRERSGDGDGRRSGAPRLRVLRVITRLNVGGPARQVAVLARELGPRGIDQVLACGAPAPGESELLAPVEEAGVPLVRIRGLARTASPLDDLRALLALWQLCIAYRPHIVHTHTAKAGALGRVAARLAGVPAVVHTFHGHVLHGYFGPAASAAVRVAERALATLTDRVIAISTRQAHDLTARFRVAPRGRTRVVPLGLDLAPFRAARAERGALRRELGLAPSALVVGAVGRLVPIKRPVVIVEAFARALAELEVRAPGAATRDAPDAHLVIAGEGLLRGAVEAAVTRAGLGARVHLLGNRLDVERVMTDLDLLVLASGNEGTPVALIEAFASGVPAVVTAVGGVPDVVGDLPDEAPALLVPADDPRALAAAIAALLADPARRAALGARGPARAAGYGAAALADTLTALYAELCPRAASLLRCAR